MVLQSSSPNKVKGLKSRREILKEDRKEIINAWSEKGSPPSGVWLKPLTSWSEEVNTISIACNLSPLFAVNCNSLLASSETRFPGKGMPQAPCASLVALVWLHQIVIPSMLPLGPPQNLTKKKRESFLATLWIITQGPPKWSVCLRLIYLIVTFPWVAPHAQLGLILSLTVSPCLNSQA